MTGSRYKFHLYNILGVCLAVFLLWFASVKFAYAEDCPSESDFIFNPLGVCSFTEFIRRLISIVIIITAPLATMLIIFLGVKFIYDSVAGNVNQIEEDRKLLLWTVIGAAVVIGASVLAQAIVDLISNL